MKRLLLSCIAVALPLAATASCKGCNQDSSTSASDASAPDAFTYDAAAVKALQREDGGYTMPPWTAIPGATAALLPNMGIGERYDVERKSRPAGIKPDIDAVMKALRGAGLTVINQKQHLAQPFGARYCEGAVVTNGGDAADSKLLDISVCEFMSADIAVMSRDNAVALVQAVPNRTVHANKQTTLVVRLEKAEAPNETARDKAFTAYDKL